MARPKRAGTTYEYTPLTSQRSTRIIKLSGALLPTSKPRFELVETKLSQPRPYEALSYTWGGQERDRPARCNGKKIFITANCEAALRRLRKRHGSRYLWVDAICINQDWVHERNVQVAQMCEIYLNAQRVLVWLGETTPRTAEAFKIMAKWWRMAASLAVANDQAGIKTLIESQFNSVLTSGDRRILYDGLVELVTRDYWTRIWTVQEVALTASKWSCLFHCGSSEPVNLEMLRWTLEAFTMSRTLLAPTKLHMDLFQAAQAEDYSFRSKVELDVPFIAQLSSKESSEPRDFIFALKETFHDELGLVDVDYSKDTGVIYREATQSVVKTRNSLRILMFASQPTKTVPCASWVPDWSNLSLPEVLQQYAMDTVRLNACRGAPPTYTFEGDSLVLSGRIFGTVRPGVSPRFPPAVAPDVAFSFARRLRDRDREDIFFGSPLLQKLGEAGIERGGMRCLTLLQAWAQAHPDSASMKQLARLVWDSRYTDAGGAKAPSGPKMESMLQTWLRQLERLDSIGGAAESSAKTTRGNNNPNAATATTTAAATDEDDRRFLATVYDRSYRLFGRSMAFDIFFRFDSQVLFWTEDGRLGLGLNVAAGDVVAVFAGCNLPFAVRPEGDSFRLVGPCHVVGAMQGEEWLEDQTLFRDFVIS